MNTFLERDKKVNMEEIDIVNTAIENLEKHTLIKGKWKKNAPKPLNGQIDLLIDNKHHQLFVEVKTELRNHHLGQLTEMARQHKPLMVIAEKIFPKIKEQLRLINVAYLETNGNIWLKNADAFMWIDTNKELPKEKEKVNRAFTKTGLKVIFHFLMYEDFVNHTYRDLATLTKVGLGNINYIMNGLKQNGYLLNLDKTRYKLVNKKDLFEKWIMGYNARLKPTLLIGTFRFLKQEDFQNWKKIPLKNQSTLWGGEPAGEVFTNYLKPGELTLYTLETKNDLIKNYRLIPDPNGNVKVYKKFWNYDEVNENVVPPLLVYADLINTEDPRCIETAQKIYEELVKDRL